MKSGYCYGKSVWVDVFVHFMSSVSTVSKQIDILSHFFDDLVVASF